jgi:hypothetical protein
MTPAETLRAIFIPGGKPRHGSLWADLGSENYHVLSEFVKADFCFITCKIASENGVGALFALTAKGVEALKAAP